MSNKQTNKILNPDHPECFCAPARHSLGDGWVSKNVSKEIGTSHFFNHLCIKLLLIIRPVLGPSSCRFCLSCTDYAVDQFSTQPFYKALLRSTRRVLLCSPLTPKKWLQKFE